MCSPTDDHAPAIYRYETHMHTSEGSICGKSGGADMAQAYAEAGYTGIIITDHFFNNDNCGAAKDLPWADRVEQFCLGYERAAEIGRRMGLHVFLGWEYNYHSTEFLTYGLGKDFLLAHQDLLEWDVATYLKVVREAGGLVSQAHPFRQRDYIQYSRLFFRHVDAVEVYNACDSDASNDMAQRYAAMNNLIPTAGSDTHYTWQQTPLSGLAFSRRLDSIEAFVKAVRAGEGSVIRGSQRLAVAQAQTQPS